jgi:hypothetical protein
VPEDEEDLRITALRQELMRRIETGESNLREDVRHLRSQFTAIKWLLGITATIFGLLLTVLIFAADII